MEQNLNYYKIFYEVARYKNISKAAEALFISQPAVSKSITKLEQNLEHTLFIRSKKGVKLTEEGKTLFEHLQQAFDSIETAEKMLNRVSQFGLGQIRIGVSTSLCKHVLLSYLQSFIKENPHVKVSIACNPTFETIQLLKEGKIDIGLICDTPLEKGYYFMPLKSIQDTFVTTQTYLDNLALREGDHMNEDSETENEYTVLPSNMTGLFFLADTKEDTTPTIKLNQREILEKSNLMLLDKGNISRIYIDQYLTDNHIHPGQVLEINNMDLLIDFAAIGMGVACVVREFVASYIESGKVIEIPMDYDIPKRYVGFIYDEKNLNSTTEKFLDFCK